MRPIIAILVVATILGTVEAYMLFQASLPRPVVVQPIAAEASGDFAVEVTLTFDAAADEFSALEPFAVRVALHGRELLRRVDDVPAGHALRIEPVTDVHAGLNEFYIQAIPREDAAAAMRAVRIRVLRNGVPLAEQTIWSEPGQAVEGPVAVDVPRAAQESTEHDHS